MRGRVGINRRVSRAPTIQLRTIRHPRPSFLSALSDLMASVGMREREPTMMARAIRNSAHAVAAYRGPRLVGFGRLVSDGTYYGSIWDVAVGIEFQRSGIGTKIVTKLLERAHRSGLIMVGLFTDTVNDAFYGRFGFRKLDRVHAMRTTLPTASRSARKAL